MLERLDNHENALHHCPHYTADKISLLCTGRTSDIPCMGVVRNTIARRGPRTFTGTALSSSPSLRANDLTNASITSSTVLLHSSSTHTTRARCKHLSHTLLCASSPSSSPQPPFSDDCLGDSPPVCTEPFSFFSSAGFTGPLSSAAQGGSADAHSLWPAAVSEHVLSSSRGAEPAPFAPRPRPRPRPRARPRPRPRCLTPSCFCGASL